MEWLIETATAIAALRMDSVLLPWLEENKYTIGLVLGLPCYVYKWYRGNVYKIRSVDSEFDRKESEEVPK